MLFHLLQVDYLSISLQAFLLLGCNALVCADLFVLIAVFLFQPPITLPHFRLYVIVIVVAVSVIHSFIVFLSL